MPYQTFPDFNQTGLGAVLTYASEVEPMFPVIMLGALFFVSLISNLYAQKRITGNADFFTSFAVTGIFISIVASLMRYLEMINLYVFSLALVIGIISMIVLMIPNEREV